MLAEDIAMVSEKIEDPVICQKIEQYCMAPFEIQEIYRKDAGESSHCHPVLKLINQHPRASTFSS
jgi:hypothetical protein